MAVAGLRTLPRLFITDSGVCWRFLDTAYTTSTTGLHRHRRHVMYTLCSAVATGHHRSEWQVVILRHPAPSTLTVKCWLVCLTPVRPGRRHSHSAIHAVHGAGWLPCIGVRLERLYCLVLAEATVQHTHRESCSSSFAGTQNNQCFSSFTTISRHLLLTHT